MKKFITAVLTVALIVFPLLMYFALIYLNPIIIGFGLFLLLALRFYLLPPQKKWQKYAALTLLALYCLCVALLNSSLLLRYYPALMNFYIALLFFQSLFSEKTLIEQFVSLTRDTIPSQASIYMRALTKLWICVLIMNGAVAAYSACCLSLEMWLFYNGFLSYVLLLTFGALELIYRQYYKYQYYRELNYLKKNNPETNKLEKNRTGQDSA